MAGCHLMEMRDMVGCNRKEWTFPQIDEKPQAKAR